MDTFNTVLFPIVLFVAYFLVAIQFLPQQNISSQDILTGFQIPVIRESEQINVDDSTSNIDRNWLENQSLANLKAIAAELYVIPTGDKRLKANWVQSIASANPGNNTVLSTNFCFA
jgi:hypothetical protein